MIYVITGKMWPMVIVCRNTGASLCKGRVRYTLEHWFVILGHTEIQIGRFVLCFFVLKVVIERLSQNSHSYYKIMEPIKVEGLITPETCSQTLVEKTISSICVYLIVSGSISE